VTTAAYRATVAYMRDHWHLVSDDESAYKLAFRAQLEPHLADVAAGRATWADVVRAGRAGIRQLLGWRVADHLQRLAGRHPSELDGASRALVATGDADAFWDELAGRVGEPALAEYDKLKSAGARASVAAIVLFLHDPLNLPPFRPSNYGRPLARILGAELDASTPGSYLRTYYDGIERLRRALRDDGLPVRSALDVQGVLWIVNYKKVLEGVRAR
jgi:hypothetical protein